MEEAPIQRQKFAYWVKIRIGQPLTAVEADDQSVIFGSISGYIGNYSIERKKVIYYQPICQEIIRGIYSNNTNKFYAAVGDRHILIKNKNPDQQQQKLNIVRSHSNNVCSHSMTMLNEMKEIIFCAFPTQKRQPLSTDCEVQKNRLYQIDISKVQIRIHRDFRMPQVAVPFDFDGQRLLWMQYKEQGIKEFQFYDLTSKQNSTIKQFGKQFHFLSFGKLIRKQCVFIENNKNIKSLNMETKQVTDLYSHTSSVIAFNVQRRNQSDYSLVSVDFNGFFIEFKNGAIIRKFNLWETKDVPEQIKKHRYLFDMGYAYYIKVTKQVIAITTDLGLCIFRI